MGIYFLIAITGIIILIGFFGGIEIAFVSVNKLSIELKKKQGLYSGKVLSFFIEKPARFAGITMLGSNVALVIYGILVSYTAKYFWKIWGLESYFSIELIFAIIASATFFLIFGLFIPQAVFRVKNISLLSFFAQALQLFYKLFTPIVSFFVTISRWILKHLFNVRTTDTTDPFLLADWGNFTQQKKENEQIGDDFDTAMFENALSLPNVKVRSCLVPRKEIEAISGHSSIEEVRQKFIESKISRLIVYEDNIDNIIGYIHQLDLFKNPPDIKSVLLPIPAVPESMGVTDLMNKFTRERKSIAWVVDEFGGTSGIITMEDLLEEIFGEIRDEHDTEELIEKQVGEREYIFSGRLEIDYIREKYGIELKNNESETLSGYLIAHLEAIPRQKERIIIDNYEFEILNVTSTRIESVKLKRL
ncbi:MAG TPA: hemolysin family protein [Chitinophagaceae bacterium]|nr:hemolysin family protein [Chitinophagaceae bacterium]